MNKFVYKELEKISGLMGAAMGLSTISDLNSKIKENKQKVQLEPLKQQEEQLQLPGSNAQQFEGGKRIDSSAVTATNKY